MAPIGVSNRTCQKQLWKGRTCQKGLLAQQKRVNNIAHETSNSQGLIASTKKYSEALRSEATTVVEGRM